KSTAKKSTAKKSTAKKSTAKQSTAKRGGTKRAAPRKSASPLERVKRVASGVVEQAQSAMSSGVDAVKELGENIVERVSG
ncbi:MAG: hypothetical protein ABI601_00005, partial [bacterium]